MVSLYNQHSVQRVRIALREARRDVHEVLARRCVGAEARISPRARERSSLKRRRGRGAPRLVRLVPVVRRVRIDLQRHRQIHRRVRRRLP